MLAWNLHTKTNPLTLSLEVLQYSQAETKEATMLKTFKVTVSEWDNEADGELHDLSHLDDEYIFQLEDRGDDNTDQAVGYVSDLTGWCVKDCDVLELD